MGAGTSPVTWGKEQNKRRAGPQKKIKKYIYILEHQTELSKDLRLRARIWNANFKKFLRQHQDMLYSSIQIPQQTKGLSEHSHSAK